MGRVGGEKGGKNVEGGDGRVGMEWKVGRGKE